MIQKKYVFNAAFAALSLALLSCDGETTTPTTTEFFINGSVPALEQSQVALNQNVISLQFSAPVDFASLSSLGSYSFLATPGGDITGQLTPASAGSENVVNFILSSPLEDNTDYMLTLNTNVKSTAGLPLRAISDLTFTTKPGGAGGGGFSIPGEAPRVTNVSFSTFATGNGCVTDMFFTFSEDLARAPQMLLKIGNNGKIPVGLFTAFNGRLDQWVFSTYGVALRKYEVEILMNEVVDLNSEFMENDFPYADTPEDSWKYREPLFCSGF